MQQALLGWFLASRASRRLVSLTVLSACAALVLPVQAHLMVAQKGTLNFSGDGAYLLMSLPVSALKQVDGDGDGLLSLAELRAHAGDIERQVVDGIQLRAGNTPMRLEGLMISLSAPDDAPGTAASQIVVMGRFAVEISGQPGAGQPLTFSVGLFGKSATEQAFDFTFTRRPLAHAAHVTPAHRTHAVFPEVSTLFRVQLQSGFEHVLKGLDHLLFLLLVLGDTVAARRGWKHVGLALSCFTLGHALTLVPSVLGWVRAAPLIVEPAIAATIVAMGLFQLWQVQHGRWATHRVQLGLVFCCALVHGLGLADAMGNLGLGGWNLAWALAGFNAGIEAAQVLVAGLSASALLAARQAGLGSSLVAGRAAPWLASCVGSWWVLERAIGWG